MIKLEEYKPLQRSVRQDDPEDLAIPTWTLVRQAIKEGKVDEAYRFMDYELEQCKAQINSLTLMRNILLTRLADFGEEEIEKILRQRYTPWAKSYLELTPRPEQQLQRFIETFRAMQSTIKVVDEPDRYVMYLDPCGTGGRLRRSGEVGPAGSTKKAYNWSWNRKGITYYCTHCCLFQEIIPIELRGYPICVTEHPENPGDPCVHLYYKKPELIPEKYFTRIGKTKTIK